MTRIESFTPADVEAELAEAALWQAKTTDMYTRAATLMAPHFATIGSRADEIQNALSLSGKPTEANVVEIGCGDGRDAEDTAPFVANYEGFDPVEGFIELAKKRNIPNTSFVVADALSYEYSDGDTDVIFAFACLLHLSRSNLRKVFERTADALAPGGLVYATFKEEAEYREQVNPDNFGGITGERKFYIYPGEMVKEIAEGPLTTVYENHHPVNNFHWLTLGLKRS